MIGARGFELYRKARGARPGKLLSVQAGNQANRASSCQNASRLCHRECATIAESITELGEPGQSDVRNHPSNKEFNVGIGASVKFRGHDVCAHKSGVYVERLLLVEFA